jgi:hypothetical protein
MYQLGGAIVLNNGPDLNAEFDSCTFASNTAGTNVSSFRSIYVRSKQPDLF